MVDLPADQQTAQHSSITLPDNGAIDEFGLPPIPTQSLEDIVDAGDTDDPEAARKESWHSDNVSFNARKQDITLSEEDGGLNQFGPRLEQEMLDPAMNESDWFLQGGEASVSQDEIEQPRRDESAGSSAAFDFDGVSFDISGGEQVNDAVESDGLIARHSSMSKIAADESLGAASPIAATTENEISLDEAELTIDTRASVQFSPVEAINASSRRLSKSKKRRVQFDDETELSAEHIKRQLKDTADVVREFRPAPSTREELQSSEKTVTVETLKRPFGSLRLAPQLLSAHASMIPEFLVHSIEGKEHGAESWMPRKMQ
eukprot:SAG31_NODE_7820_length_1589_cov_1.375839_1_plen_316_part_01